MTPRRLALLDDTIAERVLAVTREHTDWPCGAGCDDCCRALHQSPELTGPEWSRLQAALRALPHASKQRVRERSVRQSESGDQRECPLLLDGLCSVYDVRPAQCRSYGYYADRDGILGCHRVVALGDRPVVWGNHESIQSELDQLGPRRSLFSHLRDAGAVDWEELD